MSITKTAAAVAASAASATRRYYSRRSFSLSSSSWLLLKQTPSSPTTRRRSFSSDNAATARTNPFRGVWPIVATPFRDDESIDYESFEKSIDFFVNEIGVDGCTIIGVLGESNRLTDREREELIRIATSVAGNNNNICVGTSHSGTRATIELSERAMELGAHSVMITPSKDNPSGAPPDAAIIAGYYSRVYRALGDGVPVVLQDHPASTGVPMSPETLRNIISEECPSVRCIKLESLPTPPKIRALRPWIERNELDVTILTGLGALYGCFDLDAGSDGFMTGFAFPEILQALVHAKQRESTATTPTMQQTTTLFRLYQRFLPLLVFEQQPGVAVRKEIYRLRGLFETTRVRHPGKGIGDEDARRGVLEQLGECIDSVFDQREDVDLTRKIDVSKFL